MQVKHPKKNVTGQVVRMGHVFFLKTKRGLETAPQRWAKAIWDREMAKGGK
jgi:hypothetical protein